MNISTPGFVDPYKMAKGKQTLNGVLALSSMARASQAFESNDGEVAFTLSFSIDEDGQYLVSGTLEAKLAMRCQRCLQVFTQELKSSFCVSPAKDDKTAKALLDTYEPIVLVDNKLYPAELIEDELILATPLAPLHDYDCIDGDEVKEKFVTDQARDLNNPFQVLQNLSIDKKSQ